VLKLQSLKGEAAVAHETDVLRVYLADAADAIHKWGKDAVNAFADGDEQRMMLLGIKRFTKTGSFNTKDARRRIAARLLADKRYPL
jgi:hypothetical protein